MFPPLLRKIGLLLAGTLLIAVPRLPAVTLNFDVSGVGYYSPASQANNNADATAAVIAMVNWYNGGASPNGGVITYTLDAGTNTPGTLPGAIVFGFKDETAPFADVNPASYSYLLGKYGNVAYIFYIGNLAPGSYSLPLTLGGNGLSHELAFTAARTSVPEGGVTIALLGCTVLLIECIRRRLRRA